MAAPYQWFDDAKTTASARSSGDPTLTLADASKFGASGAWSTPALISLRSVGMTIVVLVATGRTGNVLSISGAAPGWTDAPTSAGASALNAVTKRDMELIWAAIDAASASTGTVTSVSVATANGVSGSVADATSTPAISLTLGAITPSSVLAAGTVAGSNLSGVNTGDQTITLGGDVSGSGTGSISATIASNAVTTTKIAANAATYAKIQAAAGAGLLGATGAGNHQLLALGTGLSLAGSTLNASGGSGTVTSVSVASANGFAGSVATATTTPAITISTTVTGLLKGNGTAVAAAAAGTDYQAPITLTTTGTSGAATLVSNTLNIPQYAVAYPLVDGASQSSGTADQWAFKDTLGVAASAVDKDGFAGSYDMTFVLARGVDMVAGTAIVSRRASAPGKMLEIQVAPGVNGAGGGFTVSITKNGTSIASLTVAASTTAMATIAAGSISDLTIAKGDVYAITTSSPGTGVQSVEIYLRHARRNR